MNSATKEEKNETSEALKEILSLLDDIRQEMVFSNENDARQIEQNKEILDALKSMRKN
ncbi:MAG: hypothetical protein IEMM0008_0139 [bacterium]|nr:MAG: hypothetical protein IEMM0008_0139 [bacterium]